MLVFEKPLGGEKRTNNKLNPHMTPVPGIEPGTALVGGERSHHCAISATHAWAFFLVSLFAAFYNSQSRETSSSFCRFLFVVLFISL